MSERKIIAVLGATGAQGGGLVRAILDDPKSEFAVRAITRDAGSETAHEFKRRGAEVVEADLDNPESLTSAFAGAYGVYAVTFYWNHFSPDKESMQARAIANAAGAAGVRHAIWSTLEDTRKWIPLDDTRMPTLMERYKVPHFDAKGDADRFFVDAGVPTTFLVASFYWDNMIHFGMGPKKGQDGVLAITFPMADRKLAGIAAEDIGKCAYGIFKGKAEYIGKYVGLAGDHITGDNMASTLAKALGRKVVYNDVSPDVYRGFGFPGSDDLGNMFQFYRDFEQVGLGLRDLRVSSALNPALQNFETWCANNASRIPIE
jgi:uncharacterized protein YbjT (DUF2867 family)